MKTAPCSRAVLALAFSALLMAGCGSGSSYDGSIYYYIETEREVNDSTLSNEAFFLDMARLGTEAVPVYYAANGQVRRSTAITTPDGVRTIAWDATTLELPPGTTCNSLVAFNGNLYGGFIPNQSTTPMGLYKAAIPATDTPSFAAGRVTDLLGKQIIRLYVSAEGGSRLIAVTAEPTSVPETASASPFTYAIYRSTDGATFEKILDAGTDLVNDINWQPSTNRYWIVYGNGTKVATIDATTLALTDRTPTLAAGEKLTAVCCTTSGPVYVASRIGQIWKSADGNGTPWTPLGPAAVSSVTVPFLSLVEIPSTVEVPGVLARVLAGTEGYGYYTLGADGTLTRLPEPYTSLADLRASAVQRFFLDDRGTTYGMTLFALTTTHGLWRGEISATIGWSQE